MKKILQSFLLVLLAQFCFAQNYGVQFDGTGGSITVCHDDDFNIGTGFTVEAWIFASEWRSEFWQGSIVNKDQHPNGQDPTGFALRAGKDGILSFVMGTSDQWPEVISSPIMNENQWYHIAGVYDNGTGSLFINGELIETAPVTGSPNFNSMPITIGDSPGFPGRNFDGVIDEVRIWNIARTQQEIADNQTTIFLGNEPGLVAYLPMDDGIGTAATNLVDNNCSGSFNVIGTGAWVDGYSIPQFDVGVLDIVGPDILSIFNRPTKAEVIIQNYGSDAVSNIPIELTINGLPTLTETYTGTLQPGETANFTFTTPLDLTDNTTNLLSLKTTYPDDGNDLNDGTSYRYKSPDNDNTVTIINEEQHNFGSAGQTRFTPINMPKNMEDFEQILIHFDLECPNGGCDPWDQPARIAIETPDGDLEIARFITPYGIECGPWTVDVTDFKTVMSGPTVFKSFIQVFGQSGWLLNCDMEFVGGTNPAYSKVNRLWTSDNWVYGDPSVMDDDLPETSTDIASHTETSHFRLTITGHGQGNTDNAAEFSTKTHQLVVNGTVADNHNLWKADCAQNPCANQAGNWMPNRAGWCPGQEVQPYIYNLTGSMTPGQALALDYELEDYTNLLNTGYNNGSHTEPHYRIHSFLIEESKMHYTELNNLRAESVEVTNDGTNFTGINFTIKNTGSEAAATAMVSYYIDGDFVFEEPIGSAILAGDTYVHNFSQVQGFTSGMQTVFAVVSLSNDENISDDVTNVDADLTSNVEQLTKEELDIFPNPSNGKFQIKVGESLLNTQLEIIDAQGRLIQTLILDQSNMNIQIAEKGIYAISVFTENGRALFGKIIVQ